MSEFKAVDNRKYNNDEINYVVSRILANWDPNIIAKAFKRDHGDYWATREFTKKQVAYIRSTYKVPPGVIKPYTGPVPNFSPSPSSEDGPDDSAATGSKRKLILRTTHSRSSTAQAGISDHPSSAYGGRLLKRRKRHSKMSTPDTPDNFDYGEGQSQASGLLSGSFPFAAEDVDRPEALQYPTDAGANTNASASFNANRDDSFGGQAHDAGAFNLDQASRHLSNDSRNLSVDPGNPSMMDSSANNPPVSGFLPEVREILPDLPIESIETPQFAMYPEAFPPGFTSMGAMAYDNPYGVWYFNPHDTCLIYGGHRHDYNGGVWFTNEMAVTQCMLHMDMHHAIGFVLGVAATVERMMNMDRERYARTTHEGNANAAVLMSVAHNIVRSNVPSRAMGPSFNVPGVTSIRSLSTINRGLPRGHFWDPFNRQQVQYGTSRHATVTPGDGHTGGVSRSGRPSIQPSLPPATGLPATGYPASGNGRPGTDRPGNGHPTTGYPSVGPPGPPHHGGTDFPQPGPDAPPSF